MKPNEFQELKFNIPLLSGIYKFIHANGEILYVGKAKNLRNRVQNYFQNYQNNPTRLKLLVDLSKHIEWTIVPNENDALILENSLIKENKPRFNIRLKDGKTYPFIKIYKEPFARIEFTRSFQKDGAEYLGPYTSVLVAKNIFQSIKAIFPLRTCNLNLTESQIAKGKYKVCLEYHIGNCLGPCQAYQSLADYEESINHIRGILKGKFAPLKQFLHLKMNEAAENMNFEKAHLYKVKIEKLDQFEAKSVIFNQSFHNILSVYVYTSEKNEYFLSYLKLENGTIVASSSYEVKNELELSVEAIYERFINNYIIENPQIKQVLVPIELPTLYHQVVQSIPQMGDKKKILDICMNNARSFYLHNAKEFKIEKKKKEFNILKELQDKLHLSELPIHIECFDNSNIQGSSPVAACVVFKQGKPSKKDYRHFHIKSVEGPNDFASMEEVIFRRYQRMIEEGQTLPQLVVIDGGKGQLSSAQLSLEKLGVANKINLISIAKKLEEIYFKNDPLPLYIDKKSPALKLIQQLRDEAHRFGLNFHRDTRSKKMLKSDFETLPGIGEKTIKLLYSHFENLASISQSSLEQLEIIVGRQKANSIWAFLQEKNKIT
ncbi:MAG: excinuclease ABC subunit UvrC [Chitinophagales bacterium]|jgi:excinuclease ABC subunit C|nr:excinuclease ABC subunit UvrC [Chitinophagales bacterium]